MEGKQIEKKLLFAVFLSFLTNLLFLVAEDLINTGGWLIGCGAVLSVLPPFLLLKREYGSPKPAQKTAKMQKSEDAETENRSFVGKLRKCLFTGVMASVSILLVLPFRLFAEKLLTVFGISPTIDLFYTSNAFVGFLITVLLTVAMTELLHRHILAPIIKRLFGNEKAGYVLMGLAYTLVYPRLSSVLSGFILGMALHHIHMRTGSRTLTALASLVVYDFFFVYNTLLKKGVSGGGGMSYLALIAILLIFAGVSLLFLFPAEKLFLRRKAHWMEILTLLCVSSILLVVGIALATLR